MKGKMMTEYEVHKEVKDLLMNIFDSVGCSSCSSYPLKEDDKLCKCENCHRKNIRWSIQEGYASIIAQRIIDIK